MICHGLWDDMEHKQFNELNNSMHFIKMKKKLTIYKNT